MSSFAMNDARATNPPEARIVRAVDPVTQEPDAGPEEFDPVSHFLVRHWVIIVLSALVGAAAAYGLSSFMTRVYRAEVLVQPVASEGGSGLRSLLGQAGGSLAAIAGLAGGELARGPNSTPAVVAMLKSRLFIDAFIDERNLLPVLFQKRWDPVQKRWRVKPGQSPPTIQDGYGMFVKNVMHVLEDKEKGLITINIEWTDPEVASDWANNLVLRLNEQARRRAILNADRSVEYLDKELEHTQTVEIRNSIYTLLEQQINNRMMANTRPDFAFTVIDPAQTPERNKFVRPIPLLMAAIGFFVGALLAIAAVMLVPRARSALNQVKRARAIGR
jgi:uncharacterized protein involved in exopolysaccharide biosynthesis